MGGQACATMPGFLHGSESLYFIEKAVFSLVPNVLKKFFKKAETTGNLNKK